MKYRKLIYKNFFGYCNILITVSNDGKTPNRDILVPDRELYETHIWIHDNVVIKNHTTNEQFALGRTISNDELQNLFGNIKK
jgi:hypothetical protein